MNDSFQTIDVKLLIVELHQDRVRGTISRIPNNMRNQSASKTQYGVHIEGREKVFANVESKTPSVVR